MFPLTIIGLTVNIENSMDPDGGAGSTLLSKYELSRVRLVSRNFVICLHCISFVSRGVERLSGRVLNPRSWGCGLEPHWRHCIVSLSKTLYPLHSTGSNQEELTGM